MTTWTRTIALKNLLSDDSSDEATRTAAAGFAKRLKRLQGYQDDYELQSIVDEFEDIANPNDDPAIGSLCEYFNDVLSTLYDWADANRIWIGDD